MNAKEQMQALMDGKIIVCGGNYYKLNNKGNLSACYEPLEKGIWWEGFCADFIFDDVNYVVDETKCVDFYHALGKMAEGKVMQCLWSRDLYRIYDGVLQGCEADGWISMVKGELLEADEMKSMWMEVEE